MAAGMHVCDATEIQLNLESFWAENKASQDKAFSTRKPRCAVGLPVDDHWLLEEMQPPSTVRYYRDDEYRIELNRQCNDRCEPAIGIRPFDEKPHQPGPIRIEHVFGSHTEVVEGGTPWLEPGVNSPDELAALLDRVERMDDRELRDLIFREVKSIPVPAPGGARPTRGVGSRGPATIGTSVMGTMNWAYWLVDEPALMQRFYELLADVLVRYHRIIADANGYEPRGYYWLDDNCALMSAEHYRAFCFPVMAKVFEAFCPDRRDYRYQHSDSEMSHLLPLLAQHEFHAVNFGPTIPAQTIRQHMPRTEIHGQLAPMTLRNGSLADVVAEVRRDFDAVGHDGGLKIVTAGSISAGTSLDSIRGLMWAVQEYTRYDR